MTAVAQTRNRRSLLEPGRVVLKNRCYVATLALLVSHGPYNKTLELAKNRHRAQRRLADEYDAAQYRGELRKRGGNNTKIPDGKFGPSDIGMTHKQVHEARAVRDAGKKSQAS